MSWKQWLRWYFAFRVRLHEAPFGGDLYIATPWAALRIADRSEWWSDRGLIMNCLGSGVELSWKRTPKLKEGECLYVRRKTWLMEMIPGWRLAQGRELL